MPTAGLAQGMRVRGPRPALLWAIAAGGCVAAAITLAFALTSDHLTDPGAHAALLCWTTLTYMFAGLVAWWRRPGSRFGPLMVAAGSASFLSSLSSANAAAPFTIGIAFDLLPAVLFLHVFLAFPGGRLQGRVERLLVGAGYFTAFGVQLVGMALDGFGPDNLLALTSEPDAAYSLLRAQLVVLSTVCLGGVVILVLRRRETPRPPRRWLAVLVDSFALALVMLAFLFLTAAFGLVSGQLAFETIRRLTLFTIGLAPLAFLVGLLHGRLARAAVGDLLIGLRSSPAPADLRAALARALRDPSLTLVFWLPEYATWADVDGNAVDLGAGGGGRTTTLIDRGGEHMAAVTHDASLDDETELLDSVVAAAGMALENGRLHAESQARLAELRASRERIVAAGDAERRRLERNLHDGAQQRLVAVALQLRLLRNRIRGDPQQAEELARAAGDELVRSLDELRELARGIHPAVLEHGLAAALDALANRAAVATTVSYEAPHRLPQQVELAAYFVACEALTNTAKYAEADSATVRVWRDNGAAFIEVADDGVGGADDGGGSGLRGLADRVEALDGTLRVTSPAGAGTIVTARLPCAS
jgi:signal transduction histidine kinase